MKNKFIIYNYILIYYIKKEGFTLPLKRMNEIKAMIAEHSTQTVSVEG